MIPVILLLWRPCQYHVWCQIDTCQILWTIDLPVNEISANVITNEKKEVFLLDSNTRLLHGGHLDAGWTSQSYLEGLPNNTEVWHGARSLPNTRIVAATTDLWVVLSHEMKKSLKGAYKIWNPKITAFKRSDAR